MKLSLSGRLLILFFVLVSVVLIGSNRLLSRQAVRPSGPSIWIVDQSGNVFYYNQRQDLPVPWDTLPHPQSVGGSLIYDGEERSRLAIRVTRLQHVGGPDRFLVAQRPRAFLQGPFWGRRLGLIFLAVFAPVALAAVYLRRRSASVRKVLGEWERGNLKARFSVNHTDELGRMMVQFDRMADRVEQLVEKLRTAEQARVQLLSELAHDIRTPLTSLRFAVESLSEDNRSDADALEDKLLALQELNYFESLVEDLFLLAQMDDTGSEKKNQLVEPAGILQSEIERLRKLDARKLAWEVVDDVQGQARLRGDAYLIKRLFRNVFENARTHARKKLEVRLRVIDNSMFELTVRDDGPGFSKEALSNFGIRRQTRFIDPAAGGRASLGLGSVILKTIATLYRGAVNARNWDLPNGEVGGAEVKIVIALSVSDESNVQMPRPLLKSA